MIFNNGKYNFLFIIMLLLIFLITLIVFFGDFEKLEKDKRKEKTRYMKYIFGFLGLLLIFYLIIKNMNQGTVKIYGINVERGLVIYIFTCFLLAFAF